MHPYTPKPAKSTNGTADRRGSVLHKPTQRNARDPQAHDAISKENAQAALIPFAAQYHPRSRRGARGPEKAAMAAGNAEKAE